MFNRDSWAASTGALGPPIVSLVRTRASTHPNQVEGRIQVPMLDITAFNKEGLVEPDTGRRLAYFVSFGKHRHSLARTVYFQLRAQDLRLQHS